MKSKHINGKRHWQLHPVQVIAQGQGSSGYPALNDAAALVAVHYILRRLARWKTSVNFYDLAWTGGSINNSQWPTLTPKEAPGLLAEYLARLAYPQHQNWLRFAHTMLGFTSLDQPLTIRQRQPPADLPDWLNHLRGIRLNHSPNECHPQATWLHGGKFIFSDRATHLGFAITYSYRHENSSWKLTRWQQPGEKLEAFLARLWRWLEPQIKWRHPEDWYHRFCVSADSMKQNEMRTCAEPERRLDQLKRDFAGLFSWGRTCPADWEAQLADLLIRDADEQYRNVALIEMTSARLQTLKHWIRTDRRRQSKIVNRKP